MRNKLLKFADFKGGNVTQDPKKQMDSAGGAPKKEKEKAFDQVKRAKLAQLDKTEPDYSKTKKVNEDAAFDAAAAKVLALETEISDKTKQLANARDAMNKAQVAASSTTTTTLKPGTSATQTTQPAPTAQTATAVGGPPTAAQPTAPAQPGTPVQQK
jgi:hypothetical protein